MKKISKMLLLIALVVVSTLSLIGCNGLSSEITIDYLTFRKVSSYTMNYGGAGAGAVVGVSVFRIETKVSDGILLEYNDFSFVNENGSPLSIISIEIYGERYDVTEQTLPLVVLDENSVEGYNIGQDKFAYIVIKCASGTLDGKHKVNYLFTTIDEFSFKF